MTKKEVSMVSGVGLGAQDMGQMDALTARSRTPMNACGKTDAEFSELDKLMYMSVEASQCRL